MGLPWWLRWYKASAYNAEDLGSIPGLGRSPRDGNGNPLQYSCLENPIDRGPWRAIVHGDSKSQTGLKLLAHASILGLSGLPSGKESTYNGGDSGDVDSVSGLEDPLEKGMPTHSSILD